MLRAHAAEGAARAYELVADELDAALQGQDAELLNLTQAAAESGYSADHLGREIARGRIPNAGRRNAPKVRRTDLPRKPGALPPQQRKPHIGREDIARAVVNRHVGGA
jgi:hypothetical protein